MGQDGKCLNEVVLVDGNVGAVVVEKATERVSGLKGTVESVILFSFP